MVLVLSFLVQAVVGFALGLVVAHLVGPDAFGRYATGLAASVALNTVLFEWLRLSATRFTGDREEAGAGATLHRGYAVTAAGLVTLSAALIASGVDLGLPPGLLAATAAVGLGMALVDYRAALARARFRNGACARLTLLRTGLGAALAIAAAWTWGDPALVLAATAVGLFLAWAMAERAAPGGSGRPRADLARCFAAYAWPLVIANALYQLLPVLNRAALAGMDGFSEAGVFALAGDVSAKLFMVAGTALDLVLFQAALRAEAQHGRAEAERRIAANAAIVFAVLLPAAAGLWLVLPAFEALLVPAAFHGRFGSHLAWLIPATFLFALVQYALNPAFQLRRRTGPVILAALAGLAVDAALLAALLPVLGPLGAAAAQCGGLAAALLVIAAWASRTGAIRLPWRDLIGSSVATLVMVGALLPFRSGGPLALLGLPPLGGALYAIVALALDVAGCRAWIGRRWGAGPVRAVPAE